jgi:hypothetical protein
MNTDTKVLSSLGIIAELQIFCVINFVASENEKQQMFITE